MLDKLKLFNKEKSDRSSKTQVSKRTSSSSGFSSARSERSDSSLSLNDGQHQQMGKLFTSVKKTESISSAKTKTKLLTTAKSNTTVTTTSTTKETINTKSKSDKKDKSPARIAELVQQPDSKIAASKIQKIAAAKTDSKTKTSSCSKKLEVRSESKTSLSHIQPPKTIVQPPQVSTAGTGIPKPTAFIKGTTKSINRTDLTEIKTEKHVDISNGNISGAAESKLQIIGPASDTAAPNFTHNHLHPQLLNQNISMTDSSHSKSTHSSSTGLHSNSSESSVIYRPSSESGSDAMYSQPNGAISPQLHQQQLHHQQQLMQQHQQQLHQQQQLQQQQQQQHHLQKQMMSAGNRKIDQFMQPVMVQENGHKFNTVPSKMLHSNGIIFEEEKQMTIMPMRPLLRGYNSHVTLPTRGTRGQHLVSEFCEDINQGYCSDGDALRKVPVRYSDIDNGYMSEGSGPGIHGKHMISVMRNGRTQLPTTIEER